MSEQGYKTCRGADVIQEIITNIPIPIRGWAPWFSGFDKVYFGFV